MVSGFFLKNFSLNILFTIVARLLLLNKYRTDSTLQHRNRLIRVEEILS